MKIQSSNIEMSALSTKTEIYSKQESLDVKDSRTQLQDNNDDAGVIVELTDNSKENLKNATALNKTNRTQASGGMGGLSSEDEFKLNIIQRMIEALTGKKFKFVMPSMNLQGTSGGGSFGVGSSSSTWSISYQSKEEYYESESVSFSAGGTVTTADGKTISMDFELNMSREFYNSTSQSLTVSGGGGNMVDPLVINYSASSAGLSDTKFSFDLDADGTSDQISTLLSGSGFLALDKNGDGRINDGKELFGTQSGDGFADLAAYDGDGNGWIDENDAIYDKLRIWVKDSNGNDKLFALGEKGVGAIYLGNVQTEYGLKNAQNSQNGQLRQTGVFLRENGSAGSIQHIDMTV